VPGLVTKLFLGLLLFTDVVGVQPLLGDGLVEVGMQCAVGEEPEQLESPLQGSVIAPSFWVYVAPAGRVIVGFPVVETHPAAPSAPAITLAFPPNATDPEVQSFELLNIPQLGAFIFMTPPPPCIWRASAALAGGLEAVLPSASTQFPPPPIPEVVPLMTAMALPPAGRLVKGQKLEKIEDCGRETVTDIAGNPEKVVLVTSTQATLDAPVHVPKA
jgi:hypothetical protein